MASTVYETEISIGETDRREHLRDVEKDDKNASKPVARHFNLPNHFTQHMAICGLSLHQGSTESRKTLEQKFIFQISTQSSQYQQTLFIQLIYSVVFHVARHQPIAWLHISVYKPHTTHNSSICSDEGLALETSASESLYGGQFTLSTQLIKPNYPGLLYEHEKFSAKRPAVPPSEYFGNGKPVPRLVRAGAKFPVPVLKIKLGACSLGKSELTELRLKEDIPGSYREISISVLTRKCTYDVYFLFLLYEKNIHCAKM